MTEVAQLKKAAPQTEAALMKDPMQTMEVVQMMEALPSLLVLLVAVSFNKVIMFFIILIFIESAVGLSNMFLIVYIIFFEILPYNIIYTFIISI